MSSLNEESPGTRDRHLGTKRIKAEGQALGDKTTGGSGKMIELDIVSSDEDLWGFCSEHIPVDSVIWINNIEES